MQINVNQVITTSIKKSKDKPQFIEDLMKYVQYLTLSSCPDDKTAELKQILQRGNMKTLLEFGTQFISDFNKQIVEYINSY